MNANEAAYLNKEIKRLQKYGIDAIVIPDNDMYNIRFRKSRQIIENYCSPTEVLGIISAIESIFERVILDEKIYLDNDDRIGIVSR